MFGDLKKGQEFAKRMKANQSSLKILKEAQKNKKKKLTETEVKKLLGMTKIPSDIATTLGMPKDKIVKDTDVNVAGTNKKLKDKTVSSVKKATGADSWKNYTTIAQAKKAGSLYYSKNGKKMAAVLKEDLVGVEGATQKAKLRNYLNKKLKNKKMSTGGVLKQPDNPGLKKLPTAVRNRMGFMKKGGSVGHTDYRKAAKGMLLVSVDMLKKKNKNK
jgi:hypothetical protein